MRVFWNTAKFNTKCHLRTFDDSLFSRFLMENFQRVKDKLDYLDMNSNQRNTYGMEMLKRPFPGDGPDLGTLGSLGQINETYFFLKGDMDEVLKRIADEVFLAILLVGRAVCSVTLW